jgi:hypothetical protein
MRIYVVPAKLSVEFIENLFENIEKNGGKTTSDPEQSDIIVTAISMKTRLLRHIRWELVVCARRALESSELHRQFEIEREATGNTRLDPSIRQAAEAPTI